MDLDMRGLEAILQSLVRLPIEEAEENKILNKAAEVVKKAAIEEAPQDDGALDEHSLKKNIKIKRAKEGEVKIHSGGAYHAHIVEGGRSAGNKYALKNGKRQLVTWGATAPNPFFSRAFAKSKAEATQVMIDEIKKVKNL
ncbi:HK97-gp10 family putative phage morphogenesis protein [Solibacillus cecembensis]|uniref:HK97-gp10 family putative phage morphogenesis protein n=1 Tax=Solibacillus cecembensis TaxID=459347 RepID=UPI003D04F3F7